MNRRPMPEAFGVTFVCAVIAPDQAAAHEHVKRLRQLSVGMGFDPGPGVVRVLAPGELARLPDVVAELERERERARLGHGPEANDLERHAALRGLCAEAGGDLSTAQRALAALERGLGYLPRAIARELATAPTTGAAA